MSLDIWKKRVATEFAELQAFAAIERSREVRTEWAKNCAELEHLIDHFNKENSSHAQWRTNRSKSFKISYLQPCATIPRGNKWVLVRANQKCPKSEENNIHNIPYFNDAEANEIAIEFQINQNPTFKIADDIFVDLIQKLKTKYCKEKENQFHLAKNVLFEALSQQIFSGECPKSLMEKYDELLKQNSKTLSDEGCNSVEGAAGEGLSRYFCRRCYVYACNLHLDDAYVGSQPSKSEEHNVSALSQSATEPCGEDCFLNVKNCTALQLSNMDVDNVEWTPDDLELFRKLRNIFKENYCIIAQSMLNKSCKQIFELAMANECKESLEPAPQPPVFKKMSRVKKHRVLYRTHRKTDKNKKLYPYTPCNHDANQPCDQNCSCVKSKNFCEKFCNCNENICLNRFIGCVCKHVCDTKRCLCFSGDRECDPELCLSCGANNFDKTKNLCRNTNIQRGRLKQLLLAPSDVAGWGIFLKNGAKKDEFITEYCGEIITQQEANRRGVLYDKAKSSFLFELNEEYVIDATRMGSKVRFANHSNNPNCYVRRLMVLGDHRIGIFAKRNILPGEELFFNYGYGPDERIKFFSNKS